MFYFLEKKKNHKNTKVKVEPEPIQLKDLEKMLSEETNDISAKEDENVSIDELDELEQFSNPNDVWLFQSNVASDSTTQNFSKTTYQTLTEYPTVSMGKSNYSSGSFSGLIGRVRKDGYYEDAALLEDWNKFCANSQLKLFKDRKGHKYIVDITSTSSQIEDATREQATTVSVGWTQIGDAEDYVIIGD